MNPYDAITVLALLGIAALLFAVGVSLRDSKDEAFPEYEVQADPYPESLRK